MIKQFRKFNINLKNCNFVAFCSTENLHTSQRFLEGKPQAVESNINKVNSILGKYDQQQEEKILKIANNFNLNELLGYEISKARANKLLAWRMRYGLLKTLNDIFLIEGFGLKVADKFFQSLLLEPKNNEEKLEKAQTRTAPFIVPSLEAEQRQVINSTVSVRMGVNSITWSRLDIPNTNTPCLLTHWDHHEVSEKKLHINELVQRCLYINHLMPAADSYVFENPQMAQASNNPGSVDQQNINIQKAQVTAIMGYALASRRSHSYGGLNKEMDINKINNLPNVFYVRRLLTARLFKHLVGTERVSSEETVLNMMRTFYNNGDVKDFLTSEVDQKLQEAQHLNDKGKFSGRVQFPEELREMFSKAPRYHREFLGQALLLNLAFVRLVLLQDAESIAAVSRSGSKAATTSSH